MGHPVLLISAHLSRCPEHPNPGGLGEHPKPSNADMCDGRRRLHCTATQPPPSARPLELPPPGNPAFPRAACAAPEQPKKSRKDSVSPSQSSSCSISGPSPAQSGVHRGTGHRAGQARWKEIPKNTDTGRDAQGKGGTRGKRSAEKGNAEAEGHEGQQHSRTTLTAHHPTPSPLPAQPLPVTSSQGAASRREQGGGGAAGPGRARWLRAP